MSFIDSNARPDLNLDLDKNVHIKRNAFITESSYLEIQITGLQFQFFTFIDRARWFGIRFCWTSRRRGLTFLSGTSTLERF